MLTRRSVIAGASAFCALAAATPRSVGAWTKPRTAVSFEIPRGACDAHVHVIGDPERFPMSPRRDNTPHPATSEELVQHLQFLHLDRVVIVTPSIYDCDNRATLAAIDQVGRDRARGVGFVSRTMAPEFLDSLRHGGIAGIRVVPVGANGFDTAAATRQLKFVSSIAEPRGWHLQISTPPEVISAIRTELASCPVPLVLDYFGWVAGGIDQEGFDAILSLVQSGRAYVKFSEPYRLSKQPPDYEDLRPVVQALLAMNPDRLLWGSGWPHVSGGEPGRSRYELTPFLPIDDGALLNLLASWVPDAETRRKILVDNPARLYGFQGA